MKTNYLLLIVACLFIAGCNPWARQNQSKQFINKADVVAKNNSKIYKYSVRTIKPYEVYRYASKLQDPFEVKSFLAEKEDNIAVKVAPKRCTSSSCMPPLPHPKYLLENYGLSALEFVGVLANQVKVGLVKTPDYGVVQVKIGEYMGKKNGKVLAITETAVLLQEKIYKGGLWEDKKTVLTIRK
ncbi:MAG: pilus assembly protein PilP [Ostreibacterium sp.]